MTNKQLWFIIIAIFVGFVAGIAMTSHVSWVMWGDSPYNETAAIWSMDINGKSRVGHYANPMFTLAIAFAFMLFAIPIAGALAGAKSKRFALANVVALGVCFAFFVGGYLWWRKVYVPSMGFPQYYLELEQISRGFSTLPKALALVAVTAGIATLLAGFISRIFIRHDRHAGSGRVRELG